MRKLINGCLLAGALAFLLLAQPALFAVDMKPFFKEGALRVLIFSGRNNHDWRTTTPCLKKMLLETGRFDVRVTEEPSGVTAGALAPYDLIVVDYCGPRWGLAAEKAVEEFVSSGKGMVVVHGAIYAFGEMQILADHHVRTGITEPPWPEYAKMAGGKWSDQAPESGHGDRHSFKVRYTDREHPIARGLKESFIATDELYHNLRLEPEARVLALAFDAPETRGTGKDEPILWTVSYGQGRVFYTALGHDLVAMSEPGFVVSFVRGCEWASTGKVTLGPEQILDHKQEKKLKLLVVTGGHDYDTEFYTLFEQPGLAWEHAVSNHEAFSSDIRDRYDVLVLYDLSNEISDSEKENLRAFVESGKGIVVLHHAIADYTSWPWWYKEVVGGKYLLEAEGDMPASTYKHGVELFVTPAARHPVTADLGALHLWDETYKGMWISPEVQVILKTDEVTSDGPVAWVSPYGKSKVIYIQLGHDRMAHLYPGYRELVRRAVLWSAERLE
ncbi:MAG TPA: ThuA domain-containing protein [archaeon]|nr:ThuA domain-containing protein [archaeon]